MDEKRFKEAFDTLSFSPDFQARTKALLRERAAGKENTMTIKRNGKMILATAACLAALAVSVSAAVYWLTPSQVARTLDEPGVADAFEQRDGAKVQTAQVGGYEVAFEGVVSGKALSERAPEINGEMHDERSYAVFAVSGGNVAELNETNDATLTSLGLSITPLVRGHAPWEVNAWTLGGGYAAAGQGDTAYFLFDTDSLEQFAGEEVYYAVFACEGMGVPSTAEFSMAEDGAITLNDGVDGAIFTVGPKKQ